MTPARVLGIAYHKTERGHLSPSLQRRTGRLREVAAAFCLSLAILAAAGRAEEQSGVRATDGFQFYWENDTFRLNNATDRWYTNGLRYVYLHSSNASQQWPKVLAAGDWWCRHFCLTDSPSSHHAGWSVGQNMYTPRRISNPEPQRNDRPWAGLLYVGLVSQQTGAVSASHQWQETLELDVGVTGRLSGAAQVQRAWHKLLNGQEPRGWDNQIGGELGLLLNYQSKRRITLSENTLDVIPHYGLMLGNVQTALYAGATVRLGRNLTGFGNDPTPAKALEVSLDKSSKSPPPRPCWGQFAKECYVFARLEARGVARNLFLDGNTFRDSASVGKEPFVYDISGGFSLRFKNDWRFNYQLVRRSEEFKGAAAQPQIFASFSLSKDVR